MTSNEILQAELLDILFEHRNKQYGAYALRKYYNTRLTTAVAISLSGVLVFVFFSFLQTDDKNKNPWSQQADNNQVILSFVEMPVPVEGAPPKPVKKQQIAQADHQNIRIVKDKEVIEPLATVDDIKDKAIAGINMDGEKPADPGKAITTNPLTENGEPAEAEKQPDIFEPNEVPPTFPGGPAALALFFSNNINPPDNIEPGEKKVVMVEFVVDADGSVTQTKILRSSGERYEREVLRAFKRMPKWNPATQNGRKIAVAFTQPVTFIGQDD